MDRQENRNTTNDLWPQGVDWRPMPFGPVEPGRIRDAVVEPLWQGRRALICVATTDDAMAHDAAANGSTADGAIANNLATRPGTVVGIRDETGADRVGFDALRVAIGVAVRAESAIMDGYLVAAPLRETTGVALPIGEDQLMTAGQVGRQMFMGLAVGRRNPVREARAASQAAAARVVPEAPAAFVATDLLWLDGQLLFDVPLLERKRLLDALLAEGELVRRTPIVRPPAEAWYGQWRALGFVEVAAKSANSRYTPGRPAPDWAIAPIPRR